MCSELGVGVCKDAEEPACLGPGPGLPRKGLQVERHWRVKVVMGFGSF